MACGASLRGDAFIPPYMWQKKSFLRGAPTTPTTPGSRFSLLSGWLWLWWKVHQPFFCVVILLHCILLKLLLLSVRQSNLPANPACSRNNYIANSAVWLWGVYKFEHIFKHFLCLLDLCIKNVIYECNLRQIPSLPGREFVVMIVKIYINTLWDGGGKAGKNTI